MKKETVKFILDSFDKKVQLHGFRDWDAAMEFAAGMVPQVPDSDLHGFGAARGGLPVESVEVLHRVTKAAKE